MDGGRRSGGEMMGFILDVVTDTCHSLQLRISPNTYSSQCLAQNNSGGVKTRRREVIISPNPSCETLAFLMSVNIFCFIQN